MCFPLFLRAAQCGGRSLSPVTSVTRASGVFTWWRESVPRGSTSTGSVSAVPPAARLCGRERTPSTLNTVGIKWWSRGSQISMELDFLMYSLSCDPPGKLYCKLHFDQRNNGTNLRRNFSLRSVSSLKCSSDSSELVVNCLTPVSVSESIWSWSWGAVCIWWRQLWVRQRSRSAESAFSRYLQLLHEETAELASERDSRSV